MQNAKELLTLVGYQPQWLIIGCVLFVSVFVWFGFVFWFTRHKVQKTVLNIGPKILVGKDLEALKRKYLGLIDEVQQQSATQKIVARVVHQRLSLLVRLFAFEASGFRAQVMTLADLERGRFPALREVIATYYPNEFEIVLRGTVEDALRRAREVVASWQ